MTKLFARLMSLAVLSFLAACTSSPFYEHRFQPAPYEVQVTADAVPGSQVRALVTVLGIARAKDGVPDRAVVRVRLENLGSMAAKLETDSFQLVTADLQAFGAPAVLAGPESPEIAPGGSAVFDVGLPLPEGRRPSDVDLSGLSLRFTMAFGEHRVTPSASFQRTDWRYYDEYPRWQFGVGVGVHT